MAKKSIRTIAFLILVSTVSIAQTKTSSVQQRADKSICTNILALAGNVDIKCSALTPAQAKLLESIPAMLKKVLANQLDPQAIMAKLDEIQKAQANASTVVASAPNGIAVSGGTVTNPTVNNFSPPKPKVTWTSRPLDAVSNASTDMKSMTPGLDKPGVEVTFVVDRAFRNPAFVVRCNVPCIYSDYSMPGSSASPQVLAGTTEPSIAGAAFTDPSILYPETKVTMQFRSKDSTPLTILAAYAYVPPSQ